MKKFIFYFTVAFIFFLNNEVFAVKVMTFNIWTGSPHKKESFIAIIKKADPDIVIINEANDPATFYEMADALGYDSVLSIHNKYNVGILSKYPILSHEFYQLETLAKALVEVKIKFPDLDKPLYVFACHLVALNLTGRNKKRAIEIDSILPYIQKRAGEYIVFAGDMNEESHLDRPMPNDCISRAIEAIGLTDSYRNYYKCTEVCPGFTHNILMIPTKRIDYIYISSQLEVTDSQTLGKLFYNPWPSDHAALISDIKLKEFPTTVLAISKIEDAPKKKSKRKKVVVDKK